METKKRKVGRPKAENPLTPIVKTRVDAETFKRLQKYCRRNKCRTSTALRNALAMLLKGDDANE